MDNEVSVQSEWGKQFDALPHMYTPDKKRGEHAIKSWVDRDAVLQFIGPIMDNNMFVERYGDFRGENGKTVRFYMLPHYMHKLGDDGNIPIKKKWYEFWK